MMYPGNTTVDGTYYNVQKLYNVIAREIDEHGAGERFTRLQETPKTVLARGQNEPIAGSRAPATEFVRSLPSILELKSQTEPEF